jgi:hypothetical protein
MWMGRPVSVERTSRCVSDLWVVKRRNSGAGVAIVVMACREFKSLEGLKTLEFRNGRKDKDRPIRYRLLVRNKSSAQTRTPLAPFSHYTKFFRFTSSPLNAREISIRSFYCLA